jgi:hypothetical protein
MSAISGEMKGEGDETRSDETKRMQTSGIKCLSTYMWTVYKVRASRRPCGMYKCGRGCVQPSAFSGKSRGWQMCCGIPAGQSRHQSQLSWKWLGTPGHVPRPERTQSFT